MEDEEEFGERPGSSASARGADGLPALLSEEDLAVQKADRAARAPMRDWIRRQRVLIVADGGVSQELWVDWHAIAVMRAGQGGGGADRATGGNLVVGSSKASLFSTNA